MFPEGKVRTWGDRTLSHTRASALVVIFLFSEQEVHMYTCIHAHDYFDASLLVLVKKRSTFCKHVLDCTGTRYILYVFFASP